jgi:hypothetical protein
MSGSTENSVLSNRRVGENRGYAFVCERKTKEDDGGFPQSSSLFADERGAQLLT